jgi:hypothetical protein
MDGPSEQSRALFTIGDVDAIASPLFCRRVRIARDLGLLDELLAQDHEAVSKRASELKARVFAQLPAGARYERVR